MKDATVTEMLTGAGLKQVLGWLDRDPEENLPKVLHWVKRFDREGNYAAAYELIEGYLKDPDNNWTRLLKSLYTDIDEGVRKKLFENFLLHSAILGMNRKLRAEKEYDCNIPWAILMDPTSACNLHCIGCWAAEYGNQLNMALEELDSIICQGKKLGTYMYIYSGGEPLVRKKDLIALCERHSDCVFLAFTNGTLIDEEFADELLRVKNFVPAISVEGFEEATDSRRGQGTYAQVVRAMELLKRKRLPFGISCCYTSTNVEVIGSEAYMDDMIAKGAKFAWFFTYMPVGKDAVPELMATAQQRQLMYRQIRRWRSEKPLFTMDFWNDGEYVGGCIAGARCYCHINAGGDIEPCAFIHYADSNVRTDTLLQAYQKPLFMAYRRNQPFNQNHLRPCPLLDNPGALTRMVEESGAASTDMESPEDVRVLSGKCERAARAWAPVADTLWAAHCQGCSGCKE